ncbi:MAG: TetR/AcrR family transcriptional regulator C-terminal domain-containing protein [Clostridia bacterium]|nr:TetR/AcrR family transcriptional regulator C-terminal domain-containing protein [Clostridia bacterium]
MDTKRLTNELIADSFKSLLLKKDFKKITVKMIAAESGFMRSTFYNYFQDKYEILEWIVKTEIYDKISPYVTNEAYYEAFQKVFKCIADEKEFYKKAFQIDGQNGFEEILANEFSKLFKKAYESANFESENPIVTLETISQYQSLALIMYIRMWICDGCYGDADYDEVCEAYIIMLFHGGSLVSTSKLIEMAAGKLWTSIPSSLKKITELLGKKNK